MSSASKSEAEENKSPTAISIVHEKDRAGFSGDCISDNRMMYLFAVFEEGNKHLGFSRSSHDLEVQQNDAIFRVVLFIGSIGDLRSTFSLPIRFSDLLILYRHLRVSNFKLR